MSGGDGLVQTGLPSELGPKWERPPEIPLGGLTPTSSIFLRFYFSIVSIPNVGLELTTLKSSVVSSIDWASQAPPTSSISY